MARVAIAGCGYVGTALGEMLVKDGHEVWGVRRDPSLLPPVIGRVAADFSRPETLSALPERIDYAVYAASPRLSSETQAQDAYRAIFLDGLENFTRALREQAERPRRIFFASSTSVYDQHRGEWVDEAAVEVVLDLAVGHLACDSSLRLGDAQVRVRSLPSESADSRV